MDYIKESIALRRFELELAEAKRQLNKKRAELREQYLERRKREFDAMPVERRRIYEEIGWSPYQDGNVIRRQCGEFRSK